MTISLLFGRKYAQSNIGGVFLDATLSEDHQYNSRVTNYPVENGQIISDHVINEPETLSITGVVTDTPLSILSLFNRSVDAFNTLVRIHNNRQLITVITGIKTYTNMVITSLNVPRNIETGQSLTFVIELQKLTLDASVNLRLDINNPFNKASDKIPREQVANADQYPFIQDDPNTSLKDQAASPVNIGIQDLQPIPASIVPNILSTLPSLQAVV